MSPVGFETKISAGERPKTYALDRAATETGTLYVYSLEIAFQWKSESARTLIYWSLQDTCVNCYV